jgi:hypothetical protein
MAEAERNIPLFTNPFLLPEGKIYDINCKIGKKLWVSNSISK